MLASLYSLPLTVLTSSENAADVKDKIKTVKSFVFTCLNLNRIFFSYSGFSGQGEFLMRAFRQRGYLFAIVMERGGAPPHSKT